MNPTLKETLQKTLAQVLEDFKDKDEIYNFLSDFLTEKEFETLAKRFSVAYWLTKNRSYANIQNNLKVSSSTIAKVDEISKKPGFKKAIKNLEAEEWANLWSKKIKKFVSR